MATKKKVAATQFILGGITFDKRDTIGQLALQLKDQKKHKLSTVLKAMKGKVKDPKYRVQILTQKGRRRRAFRIEKDRKEDVIRMVLTARSARKTLKKAAPATQQTAVA